MARRLGKDDLMPALRAWVYVTGYGGPLSESLPHALTWLRGLWEQGQDALPLDLVHDLGMLLADGRAFPFASSRDLAAWPDDERGARLDYEDRALGRWILDPSVGEFLLSHPDIKIPHKGRVYSINEGNANFWDPGTKNYVTWLKEKDEETKRPYGARYIGSLVADFHRNMLAGGIFLYPADNSKDSNVFKPKLRLVYEGNPLAFLVEQAGGMATTGEQRILDVQPTGLHQRVPLIIGSKYDVEKYCEFYAKAKASV